MSTYVNMKNNYHDTIEHMSSVILLIDGNNIAYRAASVIPVDVLREYNTTLADKMVAKRIRIMEELYEEVKPVYVFDEPRNDFMKSDAKIIRKQMDDAYKGNRPKIGVDELATVRTTWIQQWCQNMYSNENIVIAYPGAEADDIISYASQLISEYHSTYDLNTAIWSSDKDLLQCVNDDKGVYAIRRKGKPTDEVKYTESTVMEIKGVPPHKIRMQLALQGDSADGYKGIRGYGGKAGLQLINESNTIEDIMQAIPDKYHSQLEENWELAGTGSDYMPSEAILRTKNAVIDALGPSF